MGNIVLIARPVWSVLRRARSFLAEAGYDVEVTPTWSRLLEGRLSCADLCGVFLGEHGDAAVELETVRRFRERSGAQGIPVVLVGGMHAMLRADRFRKAGVDVILPADIHPEALVEQVRPLLRYGILYKSVTDQNRELRGQTLRDELTGLPNRKHFSTDLARSVEMARRIGRSLSCIIMDVDDFKSVNDAYGREGGDQVIRQFGSIVGKAKRLYDSVARLGGDEFAWLLIDVDGEHAVQAAERVRRIVLQTSFAAVEPETLKLTATFGVSTIGAGTEIRADDLVGNADRALYWGKESGKNVVKFYPKRKG